jgi:hypothetical protein
LLDQSLKPLDLGHESGYILFGMRYEILIRTKMPSTAGVVVC